MTHFPQTSRETIGLLAKRHGTPLFVIWEELIVQNYSALARLLPDVSICYAVKANPDENVIRTVLEAGGSLDVSSRGELEMSRRLQVPASKVLYTQPIKTPTEIELAVSMGIDTFVCDNALEIDKIAQLAPSSKIVLRIKVTNPYCVVNLSEKFGCEVAELFRFMDKTLARGLKLHGICFHVGSQTTSPLPFIETLKVVRSVCDRLTHQGIELKLLDIGGGFPMSYLHPLMSIEEFCEPIRNTLGNLFGSMRIVCEPGRFIVGNACVLITKVIGKALRDNVPWYYIDDGLYSTFSGKLFDKTDYPIHTIREGQSRNCVISGPTCDSFDVVFRDRSLPELSIGDVIWATNIGAYSLASASEFNGFEKPKTVFIAAQPSAAAKTFSDFRKLNADC